MSAVVNIRRMNGTTDSVELPVAPWFMATVEFDNGEDADYYIRDVVVLSATDARAARRAVTRGLDAGERVVGVRTIDRATAALYTADGCVVYAATAPR